MTRIALVVSDVDGTLLTTDKTLTDGTRRAVRRLKENSVEFTITSSRPAIGMRFVAEALHLTLPFGAFNGSSIIDPQRGPIEQHFLPASAARRSIEMLDEFGVDVWLFTNAQWLARSGDGAYVPLERRTIMVDPTIVADFTPYLSSACKIVGASPDATLLRHCEIAMQGAIGAQATVIRSQSYYLDVTPPGYDKGTFVRTLAMHLGVSTDAVATIGDMQNDLAMFRTSGVSIAMGNAPDSVKELATRVTASNEHEGFASAVDAILQNNRAS